MNRAALLALANQIEHDATPKGNSPNRRAMNAEHSAAPPTTIPREDQKILAAYAEHLKANSATKTETRAVQEMLKQDGFDIGKTGADGIAGKATKKAMQMAMSMAPAGPGMS